jgi:putative transcriptional regulator
MTAAPSHHPNAGLLQAAAMGRLSPAVARMMTAHARLCVRCAAIVGRLESVAGAAFEEDAGIDLAPGALDHALSAVSREGRPAEPELPAALATIPAAVRDIVASALGKAAWRSGGPGLKIMDLALPPAASDETFQLFRIEPGSGPPRHTHRGEELTLVLTGAFKDETGLYRPGDIAIGDASVTHRPIAEPGEVCYALAVTTAPLKFKGPLGILQRVLNLGRR